MLSCLHGRHSRLVSVLLSLTFLFVAHTSFADTVRGRVLDPQSRPVAAAEVLVLKGSAVIARAHTDSEGRFGPLTLAPGAYEVVAGAPGLRSVAHAIAVSGSSDVTLDITTTLAAVGETVVVSAAQVETPLSRVTDSVTVVDRETLATHQTDVVADAVRLVPGFHVASNGGRGTVTSFFPRGGESDYTLVLVDGIAQNAFGGGFDGGHLSAVDAERIEVVRGPQSALYGGGAIGGIVQLVTRHGGRIEGSLTTEYGSFDTELVSAGVSGSGRQWTWGGSANWLHTDGQNDRELASGIIVTNDDYERAFGSASLAWSDRPGRRVRFDIRGGRTERGNPGAFGSDPLGRFFPDPEARGNNRSLQTGVSGVFSQGAAAFHRVQFTTARHLGHFNSQFGASDDDTRRVTGRYQFDFEGWPVGLTAGAEFLREKNDNTFITAPTDTDPFFAPVPVERSVSGWFVEARPSFAGRVFMNVGARLERIERTALAGDGFSRPDFASDVVWSANPKLALAWFLRTTDNASTLGNTRVRLGAGTGIKPPTAFEIGFTNNPELTPERSRSFDLGLEQAFAGGAALVDVTWFKNNYDDLIIAVRTELQGPLGYRTDNIANARAAGVELGATWRAMRGLSARVSWTYLDTEVLDIDNAPGSVPAPYVVGDSLLRRPRQRATFDLTWTGARGSAFLSMNGRGAMLDLEPNFGSPTFHNPGFTTTNIGASLRLGGWLNVFGRVNNLLDREYEEVFGYPALGRSATIGVRVTPGR